GIHSVYFTGDSGYSSHFKEVYKRLGKVDVMLSDAGQYNTKWSKIHMRPMEALEAASDVQAKYLIPVHWGVFALSNHDWNETPKIMTSQALSHNIIVITPKIGQRIDYQNIMNYQDSWWNLE
ncbi:MAG: MBL fold metallo-hydrolase, partial [Bacilli bacterium]|nr:MBL fold metallo-hydrolase [Bacilli bacterium]